MTVKHADITFQQNQFLVTGELTMANVMSVRDKSITQFAAQPELVIDFSQLSSCDSSGLALILDWIVFAKQTNKTIRFRHLSPELMSIAKAAGLEVLLLPFME